MTCWRESICRHFVLPLARRRENVAPNRNYEFEQHSGARISVEIVTEEIHPVRSPWSKSATLADETTKKAGGV